MFIFNRSKKSNYADFGEVYVDMHSHLIPGVDDGAKNPADSITLINGLKQLGFEHIITTPHTLQDIHPNTKETLTAGHELIKKSLPAGITVNLSSEYYLDDQFQSLLDNKALLPLHGHKLLIEFSQISHPFDLEERIFDLGIKGYQVILAHPERYLSFHNKFDYYERLRDMGVEFQVNAMSLTNHYGKHIRLVAEKLIEKDMIDYIGTDIHHTGHLPILKRVPESKYFARLIDSRMLKNQSLI
jgi:protein-tyrosine phosphatase